MVVHALRDGTAVRTRPIAPGDKGLLSRGLNALSAETVRRRFLAPKPRFTAAELRYLTEVDGQDHVALVAERPGEPDSLLGVGRFVRLADDPEAAEVAIVVADPLQGRGLGSLLGSQLAERAAELGIRRFTATIAGDNRPAQALMAKLSGELERHHAGAVLDLSAQLAA